MRMWAYLSTQGYKRTKEFSDMSRWERLGGADRDVAVLALDTTEVTDYHHRMAITIQSLAQQNLVGELLVLTAIATAYRFANEADVPERPAL